MRAVTDDQLMASALAEAVLASDHGDVPVGAVVARDGEVIAGGHNRRVVDADPTAHAEIVAIRAAARALGTWRLDGCTVAVTLEPCPMCAGALVGARVDRLVMGAPDLLAGAVGSLYNLCDDPRLNHQLSLTWKVQAAECSALLSEFFADRRP